VTTDTASSNTKKTWLSIATAAVLVACVLAAAAIGGTAFYVFRHIDRQTVTATAADAEFTKLRARFVREQPLVEITSDRDVMIHPNTGDGGPIRALHLLAYNPVSQRLVHVNLPVWLLRAGRAKSLALIDQGDFGSGGTHLTLDDIERHGPGLILDHRRINGAQAIVWAE